LRRSTLDFCLDEQHLSPKSDDLVFPANKFTAHMLYYH
jgi:hypothetical protein